jgi:hypothetical protein
LTRAGVYILAGPAEDSTLPQVYVGEGDPVRPRLEQHERSKGFWTTATVFTSKDQSLNKAHVQHLEARLVEMARKAKLCVLHNSNVPQPPSLSDPDTAEINGFLEDVLLCLPVIGCDFFKVPPHVAPSKHELFLNAKGIQARGYVTTRGFVVRASSKAVMSEVPSIHDFLRSLRKDLVEQGVLVRDGASYELAQDYTFSSASTAAGVLLGKASNGRTEWKTADGRTLKTLQEAEAS